MNTTEMASLRAEIEELKLQRQELRTLNTYRENEATKWQKEAKAMEDRLTKVTKAKEAEARSAQAKIEQLTRTVESMRDKEVGLLEDRRRMTQEIVGLKRELREAKDELALKAEALEESEERRKELEGKLEQSEASWRIDRFLVLEEVGEIRDLKEKLRVSEDKVKSCQKRIMGLEERLKGEEEKVKQCQKTINELRRTRQE